MKSKSFSKFFSNFFCKAVKKFSEQVIMKFLLTNLDFPFAQFTRIQLKLISFLDTKLCIIYSYSIYSQSTFEGSIKENQIVFFYLSISLRLKEKLNNSYNLTIINNFYTKFSFDLSYKYVQSPFKKVITQLRLLLYPHSKLT